MSSTNSVNGNGNNINIAKVKQADTPQAIKDAAVASKEVVEGKVEKSVEVSKATFSAAIKNDSVQISNEAKKASKPSIKFMSPRNDKAASAEKVANVENAENAISAKKTHVRIEKTNRVGYKAENKRDNMISDDNSVKKDNVKETPSIKETVANSVSDTHKPGMAQLDKNIQEDKKSSFGINRIGDYEDASGDFSDVSFMSSMSSNINEGFGNYK
jgi:hypothetical protein